MRAMRTISENVSAIQHTMPKDIRLEGLTYYILFSYMMRACEFQVSESLQFRNYSILNF